MIVDGEYPSDIRVRKEAESLSLSGLEIQVVTRWKRGQTREEKIKGVKVCSLGRNYSFRRKGLNDVLSSILFFDFLFYFQLKSFSRTNELGSIVHVHDLPLLRTIRYLFPKKHLILDMHENYPEMLLALKMTPKSLMKRMKDRLFFSTKRWKRHEKYAIQLPNHIIAVVAEMKEKIIREYNIHSDKISVISNYEKL
ncbi:MAG: glycosyltransferase, partial [Flavobacteriales bacterium]|nr:glycosyltransferase [Flavobacteriales bacterium]